MGPIQKAIDDVKFQIPKPILDKVFTRKNKLYQRFPEALDTRIRTEVIEQRVRKDCNIMGGVLVEIPLIDLWPETVDQYAVVYVIPKRLTQGRSIVSVLSVTFGANGASGYGAIGQTTYNYGAQNQCGNSMLMDAAAGVMQAMLPIPLVSTAQVQLIGENTVMVNDYYPVARDGYLRCYVENDSEMSNLKPRSWHHFSKLVVLAVKAYIYNEYIIELDRGTVEAGFEIGTFKSIVEGYADANELYDDYLKTTWARVQFLGDTRTWERHVRMIVGGFR